jgi:hypothetical protein
LFLQSFDIFLGSTVKGKVVPDERNFAISAGIKFAPMDPNAIDNFIVDIFIARSDFPIPVIGLSRDNENLVSTADQFFANWSDDNLLWIIILADN